ncbi:hypothetical protein ATANTOWER_032328 [Ataeniobius toweri]|uniref:Secreted protein n=1 Tax=Ataeniobius toweri TaxID=208326 RepID=A0ABU7AVQ2_9TELE|nr:hypothetical protein [Ataeniobius toweri]
MFRVSDVILLAETRTSFQLARCCVTVGACFHIGSVVSVTSSRRKHAILSSHTSFSACIPWHAIVCLNT